ncbi:MAG: prolipoprotein diacylglyceryl transferase [Clostridiales bacterium]|nr:prolipoprotein diacylglyceryl transferase [Clostridiales bacterium]
MNSLIVQSKTLYDVSWVSFPGLGIQDFTLNSVCFNIFGREVAWYGVLICLGIILAVVYVAYRAKQVGIKFNDILDYTLFSVPLSIIGARLYFVIFYGNYNSFLEIIAIWNGGLAIYGGIIFGVITVIVVSKFKKQNFFKVFDCISPAVMMAQAIGRWGNFMNGEAFGGIVSESSPLYFIRMGIKNTLTYETFGVSEMVYVHPTFLYESLWNVIGFVLINLFYKKKKYHGQILLAYLGWYGLGRAFIEMLRTDSLYIGSSSIRVSSLVGAICVVIIVPLLIILNLEFNKRRDRGEIPSWFVPDILYLFGVGKRVDSQSTPIEEKVDQQDEKEEFRSENIKATDIEFDDNINADTNDYDVKVLVSEDIVQSIAPETKSETEKESEPDSTEEEKKDEEETSDEHNN